MNQDSGISISTGANSSVSSVMNQWSRHGGVIASLGTSTTGSTSTEEEYIDYSCSTPLERFARDIETIFRKWHVHDTDRHVSSSSPSVVESPLDTTPATTATITGKNASEPQQQHLLFSTPPRSTAGSSKNHNATILTNTISSKKSIPIYPTTTSISNPAKTSTFFSTSSSSIVVFGGPDSTTPLSHTRTNLTTNTNSTTTTPWSPSSTTSSTTASVSNRSMSHYSLTNATIKSSSIYTTPIGTAANTKSAAHRNVRCLRQRIVTFYPTPNPQSLHFLLQQHCTNKVDPALHRGIPLLLTLWDGPPTTAANQQLQLPWSLQRLLTNNSNSSLTNPLDLSSLLSIGQHITLTPPPATTTTASSASTDHHQNLLETIIQLHYLPSITTAFNIALSNAACAIPAFVLGTYYDPSTTTTATSTAHKSGTIHSLVPQHQHSTYLSYSSKMSFTSSSSSTSSIFTSISSTHKTRKQPKSNTTVPQQQAVILRPIPNWLLLGNTSTITSIPSTTNPHDSFCIPSLPSTVSTQVVGHCLPVRHNFYKEIPNNLRLLLSEN